MVQSIADIVHRIDGCSLVDVRKSNVLDYEPWKRIATRAW